MHDSPSKTEEETEEINGRERERAPSSVFRETNKRIKGRVCFKVAKL
jgi:hypothetical protein